MFKGDYMSTIFKELTVELNNEKQVTVEVEVTGSRERYGDDADGNRGSWEWFVQDVDFSMPSFDDDNNPLDHDEKNEVEKLISERVDEESWNFEDEY